MHIVAVSKTLTHKGFSGYLCGIFILFYKTVLHNIKNVLYRSPTESPGRPCLYL
jgi:tRNA nucleotidyltransferase (CCA-adding enzyme)